MEDFESLVHVRWECKYHVVSLISREFRIQNSEFRSRCRSRSSGTDSSPSDRGNLPELKLGAHGFSINLDVGCYSKMCRTEVRT